MENRIIALINEKDVMLGAIGHDLKTPLAALRVRIAWRTMMPNAPHGPDHRGDRALARRYPQPGPRGRPSPLETTELSALVASMVEDYEDMGEPVELDEMMRIACPCARCGCAGRCAI
jgi:signal transduction histidine kinase